MFKYVLAFLMMFTVAQANELSFLNNTINEVRSIAKTEENKEAAIKEVLNKVVHPTRSSRFSLGPFSRKATSDQLKAITNRYVQRLADMFLKHSDESDYLDIVFKDEIKSKGKNSLVHATVVYKDVEYPMTFWLRVEKDASYTIFDVNIAGIWLVQSRRPEFITFLKKNNGDINILIKHLNSNKV